MPEERLFSCWHLKTENAMVEESMAEKTYQPGENYNYPLIIKKVLDTPLIYSPEREIVYDDKNRYTYQTLGERRSV
jgi:hypothetical protein